MKRKKSIYEFLEHSMTQKVRRTEPVETIRFSAIVLELRKQHQLSGAELCRRAGDLDPRTLTALEKGRIKNPSIKTLESLARGFEIPVSNLFQVAEKRQCYECAEGSKKGHYQIDFPNWGVRVTSFTPLTKEFFCGKLIVGARKRLQETLLKHPKPLFISVLVGRFEVTVQDKSYSLKEGDSLFFNGILNHTFYNPLHRDSSLMMVTAPSFL